MTMMLSLAKGGGSSKATLTVMKGARTMTPKALAARAFSSAVLSSPATKIPPLFSSTKGLSVHPAPITHLNLNHRSFASQPLGNVMGGAGGQQQQSYLDQFSVDLTEQAKDHKLDPIIGRHDEIRRCLQILARRSKNNPILIGEAGVGTKQK
jgi:ATP-dependent Clp protease ATP-binding subunit ClpA